MIFTYKKEVLYFWNLSVMWAHWSLRLTARTCLISCMPTTLLYHFLLRANKNISCAWHHIAWPLHARAALSSIALLPAALYHVAPLWCTNEAEMAFQLLCISLALDVVIFLHLGIGASCAHIPKVPRMPGNPRGPHTHFTWGEMHGLDMRTITYRNTCVKLVDTCCISETSKRCVPWQWRVSSFCAVCAWSTLQPCWQACKAW